MWKLDPDEDFFRIYDSKKLVAGYFDPDYGDIHPKENSAQVISEMLKNHEKILGGAVTVPLVKFGLFDTDLDADVFEVDRNVQRVHTHLDKWKAFLSEPDRTAHLVKISHTDQDMLTVTFQARFSKPVPLHKNDLIKELLPTLDLLQKSGLL